MKRAKLSFSNIILITACLVVVVSILFLNVINTRNIITLKNSIDTLSIENKNISLLRNTSDELVELELVYNKYLQTGEASLINTSAKLLENTIQRLKNLQQERDSGRAAQIVQQLAKERSLPAMIADFENLSAKFKSNKIDLLNKGETDSVNAILAIINSLKEY